MSDTTKSPLMKIALVTVAFVIGGVVFRFGDVFGDVKHLEEDIALKANSAVVDAENKRVWDAVGSNSELMKVQIANIDENIALMQQDIRQLRIDMQELAKSR